MAINLTVALTDAEQARIVEVAAKVSPGMTGPQLKTWAEKFCKDALRAEVLKQARATQRDAENAARAAKDAEVEATWPA